MSLAPAIKAIGSEAPVAGSGWYLGMAGDGTSYMYVAPKSTEVQKAWGSYGSPRGALSTTNGLANTNTLYAFGSVAHPAAYYAKSLTTGGYNTWYLPAKNELNTMYSNKSATPFVTNNAFVGSNYWTSTEYSGQYAGQFAISQNLNDGGLYNTAKAKNIGTNYVRATRMATV